MITNLCFPQTNLPEVAKTVESKRADLRVVTGSRCGDGAHAVALFYRPTTGRRLVSPVVNSTATSVYRRADARTYLRNCDWVFLRKQMLSNAMNAFAPRDVI